MIRFIIAKILFFFYYRIDLLRGNDGTAYPGRLLLKICPDFIKRISKGIDFILVSGTNGKSTTTKMIASELNANGINCIYNYDGGNIDFSIASSLARQMNIFNRHKIEKAVIECDEASLIKIINAVDVSIIVLTIFALDQTDRFPNVDYVTDKIKAALDKAKNITLCLNVSDENNRKLRNYEDKKYIYYKRVDNYAYVDDEKFLINLKMKGDYNIENAAAALSAAKALNILNDKSIEAVCNLKPVYGRFETFKVNGKDVTLTLVQNPLGTELVFKELYSNAVFNGNVLFFGCREMSEKRQALEVLDNIDFEIIKKKFDKIYMIDSYDIINKYLGGVGIPIDEKDLVSVIEKIDKPVVLVLHYLALMRYRRLFVRKGYINDIYVK